MHCLKNATEDELTLDFHTRHGFVTNVTLEATIDTAEFEEYRKELREEGAPDGPTASFWVSVPGFHTEVGGMQEDTAGQNTDAASDIIGGADGSTDIYLGSTGVITEKLSFAFADPENPNAGFESSLKLENGRKMRSPWNCRASGNGPEIRKHIHFICYRVMRME